MGYILENLRYGILRRRLFGQRVGIEPGKLTKAQRRLAQKFREGIAEALGVPPEAIREDVVERWIVEWTKAFVKPEYWHTYGIILPNEFEVKELGRNFAYMFKQILNVVGRSV